MSSKQWLVLMVLAFLLFLSPVLLWSFVKYWAQFLMWWTESPKYTVVFLMCSGIGFLIVGIGVLIERSRSISIWWNSLNPNSNRNRY